ncbi:hypothetical protein INT45_007705 [Circinella minor]|uniref:Uncharacterized protein n=1 Tax=Circinella minor TaxID=1195481 RepID=A0A8H7RSB0_9FUNG|nr:hypothetical protein INT45_007705 [Circinella minor]
MPGLTTPQNERFGVHDMPPNECYDRIDEFVNANKNVATSFTADDDNQNMGLLSAHLANNQTRATNVALNRRQIVNYLLSHGYVCEGPAGPDSTAIRCVPEQLPRQ